MTQTEKQIIFAYAENNMNASSTAKSMNFHRNSILYQLERIEEKYGLNPKSFYGLSELINIIKRDE